MYQQGYLNVGVVKSRSKGKENPDASSCVEMITGPAQNRDSSLCLNKELHCMQRQSPGLQWKLSLTQATDQ